VYFQFNLFWNNLWVSDLGSLSLSYLKPPVHGTLARKLEIQLVTNQEGPHMVYNGIPFNKAWVESGGERIKDVNLFTPLSEWIRSAGRAHVFRIEDPKCGDETYILAID